MNAKHALLPALFAIALLVAAPISVAEETADMPEAQTVTGHVVDLHHYLTTGELHAPATDKNILDVFAPEAPIALVVDDKTLADKLVPGKKAYLLMFNGNEENGRSVYSDARKLLGQAVAVTGRVYERDGLTAISIIGVHSVPDAQADTGEHEDSQM